MVWPPGRTDVAAEREAVELQQQAVQTSAPRAQLRRPLLAVRWRLLQAALALEPAERQYAWEAEVLVPPVALVPDAKVCALPERALASRSARDRTQK